MTDNNPNRLDDGARAEAEMKEREAPSYGEPVAWRYISPAKDAKWTVQKNYPAQIEKWKGYKIEPLYAALPVPQGDDTLAGREKLAAFMIANSIATGHGDTIDDLLAELGGWVAERRSQASEIAGLRKKYEMALTVYAGCDHRREAAEARLASVLAERDETDRQILALQRQIAGQVEMRAEIMPNIGPRPPYCKPREFLLLASYCGDDTPGCTDARPCVDCLAMCNVFGEDGTYLRQLGTPAPPIPEGK